MTTIKCVLIPADEERDIELIEIEQGDYRAYQTHVGGPFDCINLDRPSATLFVHDESKILGLPLNRKATLILWTHNDRYRGMDFIAGDCVLAGQPDQEGETLGCPDELIDLLFNTTEYRYMVKTINEDGWHGNARRYDNWLQAYNDGVGLAERWALVESVKVVSAS
jgi:hypothetical protein